MFWSVTSLSTCSFSSFTGEQVGYFCCQNNIIIVSDFSAIHCISVLPSKIRVALNCHASHNITVLDISLKRPSLYIICIANSYVNDLNNFWVPFILDAQFRKKNIHVKTHIIQESVVKDLIVAMPDLVLVIPTKKAIPVTCTWCLLWNTSSVPQNFFF